MSMKLIDFFICQNCLRKSNFASSFYKLLECDHLTCEDCKKKITENEKCRIPNCQIKIKNKNDEFAKRKISASDSIKLLVDKLATNFNLSVRWKYTENLFILNSDSPNLKNFKAQNYKKKNIFTQYLKTFFFRDFELHFSDFFFNFNKIHRLFLQNGIVLVHENLFVQFIEREISRLVNFDLFDFMKFHFEFLFVSPERCTVITKKSFWRISEWLKKLANNFTKKNACFYFSQIFEFIESENFPIYKNENKNETNLLIIKESKFRSAKIIQHSKKTNNNLKNEEKEFTEDYFLANENPFKYLSEDWFNEKNYPEFESKTIFDLISIKKAAFYSKNLNSQDTKLKKANISRHKNFAFILYNKAFSKSKKLIKSNSETEIKSINQLSTIFPNLQLFERIVKISPKGIDGKNSLQNKYDETSTTIMLSKDENQIVGGFTNCGWQDHLYGMTTESFVFSFKPNKICPIFRYKQKIDLLKNKKTGPFCEKSALYQNNVLKNICVGKYKFSDDFVGISNNERSYFEFWHYPFTFEVYEFYSILY